MGCLRVPPCRFHDVGVDLDVAAISRRALKVSRCGSEYKVEFVPKVKLELVLDDEALDGAVEAISKAARTGKFGDGKIFVFNVDDAIRIRTGEHGEHAV